MKAVAGWGKLQMPPLRWRRPVCVAQQVLPQPWVWALPPFPPLQQSSLLQCPGTRQEPINIFPPPLIARSSWAVSDQSNGSVSHWQSSLCRFQLLSQTIPDFLQGARPWASTTPFTAALHNTLSGSFPLFCAQPGFPSCLRGLLRRHSGAGGKYQSWNTSPVAAFYAVLVAKTR